MSDTRIYVFGKINGRWGFIAHTGTDVGTSDVVHIPIETWTTDAGEHQLCRVGYSKQRAADWTLRAARGDVGMMEGPDLFVVTHDKQVVLSVWKPQVDGIEISSLTEDRLVEIRRRTIAFVFQSFGLVPILTAAENVEVPLRLVRAEPAARDRRVEELLDLVGLHERARHRPHELSGGEQQRVAIARALANRPRLLLADEPTGQLDSETGHRIMLVLRSVVRAEGITAIVATHDPMMLDVADRVVELRDGHLLEHQG